MDITSSTTVVVIVNICNGVFIQESIPSSDSPPSGEKNYLKTETIFNQIKTHTIVLNADYAMRVQHEKFNDDLKQ